MVNYRLSILFSLFIITFSLVLGDNVILQPTKKGKTVGYILIEGTNISPSQYVPLAKTIQSASSYALWVGIPQFLDSIPDPLTLSNDVNTILGQMYAKGFPQDSPIFFAGHSLGGFFVQSYVANDNPSNCAGVILMGSFVIRSYGDSYPYPVITIGGELDGLARVTRLAESYWRQNLDDDNTINKTSIYSWPVVVVNGMSHMQFASGELPDFVKENDLEPEISYAQAHSAVAKATVAFMQMTLDQSTNAYNTLYSLVSTSGSLLLPIVESLQLEGYYFVLPPCDPWALDATHKPVTSKPCIEGSPWTQQVSTPFMDLTGLDSGVSAVVTDAFHAVWEILPVHLPHIYTKCSVSERPCELNITTVSQNVYSYVDEVDTGFYAITASEIRTKMPARQAAYIAAGYTDADFNVTDAPQICSQINSQTYQYALKNLVPQKTLARFQRIGVPYVFGDDLGPYVDGPQWIWYTLEYNQATDSQGNPVIKLQSPMMKTPVDYWLSTAAGFHYCKVLSPARVMEWVYIDSLRLRGSVNATLV